MDFSNASPGGNNQPSSTGNSTGNSPRNNSTTSTGSIRGGLMQLVAYGAQDVVLTGDPD